MNYPYCQPVAKDTPKKTALSIIAAVLLFLGGLFSIIGLIRNQISGVDYFYGESTSAEIANLALMITDITKVIMLIALVILTGIFLLVNIKAKCFKVLFAIIGGFYVSYYISYFYLSDLYSFIEFGLDYNAGWYYLNYVTPLAYVLLIAFVCISGKNSVKKFRDTLLVLFIALISIVIFRNICVDIMGIFGGWITETTIDLGVQFNNIGLILFALYLNGITDAESEDEPPKNEEVKLKRTPFHFIALPFFALPSLFVVPNFVKRFMDMITDIQDYNYWQNSINEDWDISDVIAYRTEPWLSHSAHELYWFTFLFIVSIVGLTAFILYTVVYRNKKVFSRGYLIAVIVPVILGISCSVFFYIFKEYIISKIGLYWQIRNGIYDIIIAFLLIGCSLIASAVGFFLMGKGNKTLIPKILLFASVFGADISMHLIGKYGDFVTNYSSTYGKLNQLVLNLIMIGVILLSLAFIFPYRKPKPKVEIQYQQQFAFAAQPQSNVQTAPTQPMVTAQQIVTVANTPIPPVAPQAQTVAVNTAQQIQQPRYVQPQQYAPQTVYPPRQQYVQQPTYVTPQYSQQPIPQYAPPVQPITAPAPHQNVVENSEHKELVKLKAMLDEGLITEEDYNTKKKQILGL